MKLNPFDLTKALSGEYEIFTRDGRKVEQLFYFDKASVVYDQRLFGVVDESVQSWRDNGMYSVSDVSHPCDLSIAHKLVDRWINVYINKDNEIRTCGLTFSSKEEADMYEPFNIENQTIKIQVEL